MFVSLTSVEAAQVVTVDGNSAGRLFDGIGMVNSSGTSKLLADYPADQQADILDFLFKPNFGAGLSIIKNEIGADIKSSSGTEPCHQRLETDTHMARGVNFYIGKEAKSRNSSIKLAAGHSGIPAWANSSDTQKKNYYLSLVKVMADTPLDYLSPEQNEGLFSRDYVVNTLKPTLDSTGY